MQQHSQGVALITALFVTAIATITVVSLTSRQFIDIRRTGNAISSEQAYVYAVGAESIAKEAFVMLANSLPTKADIKQMYNVPIPVYSEGTLAVSVTLIDMEGRLNLNRLAHSDDNKRRQAESTFRRILQKVTNDLGISGVDPATVVNSVYDWIDENSESRFQGAEDSVYESFEPGYKAANRMMASVSELQLVHGIKELPLEVRKVLFNGAEIDDEFKHGLSHYVTVLPDPATTINLNTVELDVLETFSSFWDSAQVAAALADREQKPIESGDVQNFTTNTAFKPILDDEQKKQNFEDDLIGLFDGQSTYIMLNSIVSMGEQTYGVNSLVYRNTSNGKLQVLARAMGTNEI
jgi:general secretion pathway protein K